MLYMYTFKTYVIYKARLYQLYIYILFLLEYFKSKKADKYSF